jgi:hypothetical protein
MGKLLFSIPLAVTYIFFLEFQILLFKFLSSFLWRSSATRKVARGEILREDRCVRKQFKNAGGLETTEMILVDH